jgi:hypothetical protein
MTDQGGERRDRSEDECAYCESPNGRCVCTQDLREQIDRGARDRSEDGLEQSRYPELEPPYDPLHSDVWCGECAGPLHVEDYLRERGFTTYEKDGRIYWGHPELGAGRTLDQAIAWQRGREQERE